MNWRNKITLTFAVCSVLIVSGCGKPKDETGSVPVANDPSAIPTETIPTYNAPSSAFSVPANSVSLKLIDKVTYKGLEDLAGAVFLPLVGDAKISLNLTRGRSTTMSGNTTLAFEDHEGGWKADIQSFPGTGFRSSTAIDIIFADDELVTRVIGYLTGDDLAGHVYYRKRATGDTACKKVQVSCNWYYPSGYWSPFNTSGTQCTATQPDTATPCRVYMSTTDASVKKLGTFNAKYSSFATLSEE